MEIQLPPAHPLIVHLAVVLLPLVALGAIAIVLSVRARRRYGSLVAVGAVVAAAATIGARLSGELLAGATTATGTLGAHMFWGLIAPWPASALALAVVGFLLVARGSGTSGTIADVPPGQGTKRLSQTILGVVTVVLALASLTVVAITGHLGATAVWIG